MAPVNHGGFAPVIHGGDLPSDRGGVAPAEFWLRGDRPRRPREVGGYGLQYGLPYLQQSASNWTYVFSSATAILRFYSYTCI